MMQVRAVAIALAMFACDASAQSAYPNKSIRILIPFPPGGSTDFLARGIGQKITEAWGQQVVIDNRGGAAGILATDIVAKAAPDGYTLLMNAISHAANASLYRNLPYDTLRDFAPVTSVADVPIILVLRSQLSVNSVKELIALARAKPGQITFAAGGVGASSHLAGELFRVASKIEWQTVQYKGGGPALIDLLGNQVAHGIDAELRTQHENDRDIRDRSDRCKIAQRIVRQLAVKARVGGVADRIHQ